MFDGNLVGIKQIREHGLVSAVNAVCECSLKPFDENNDLFEGLGILPDIMVIRLKGRTIPLRVFSLRTTEEHMSTVNNGNNARESREYGNDRGRPPDQGEKASTGVYC